MAPPRDVASARTGDGALAAIGRHVVHALAALLFAVPLIFLVAGSLRPVGLPPPTGLELVPPDATLDAYRRLPRLVPLTTYLRNSTLVVSLAVPLTVLVASLAGFGIRMLPPSHRRVVVAVALIVMAVPVTAVWATRFQLFRLAGTLDTVIPLISTATLATNPFYALIFAWSFGGLPDAQLDAARLEGASSWRIWRTVAMPQARAAILAVAVLSFTFHWGNFIDALLYLQSQQLFTLPIGLRFLQLLNPTDFPLLLAGSVVVTVPAVAVFLLAQRVLLEDPLRAVRARRRGGRRRAGRIAGALLALGLLAAGCGGGAGGDANSVTVVLFGDPTETAGYEQVVAQFEEANPDVDVTLSPTPSQDELLAKLTTSFQGGDPPDVFLANFRTVPQFAEQGVLEPVQPYLEASDVISPDDYEPVAFDAFSFDGEQVCMPQNLSSLVVYYNVDAFAEAGLPRPATGWTWDDFLTAAQALTDAPSDRWGVGVAPQLIRLAPFVWSSGGELVDDTENPTTLVLDQPEAQAGVDFFLDLSLEHGVVPDNRAEQARESEARFLDGDLGMFLSSRRDTPTMRTITDFEWDVAPMPIAPGGEAVTMLHSDAYCMSAASSAKDAAWRFIEFAMSDPGQRILAESGRTVPSRITVQRSEAFLDPDQPPAHAEVFLDAIPTVRATPTVGTWPRVEDEADRILEEVFYGRIGREEGIEQMVEVTRPLLGG
jgi:multiple sugar transport system substrate-binding protein